MQIRTKFLIFISIVHIIFIGTAIILFQFNKLLFVICEGAILLSVIFSISFYRSVFRPFKLLNAGTELISDEDFSMKIRSVGHPELDKLIGVFNKMIDHLRLERTKATEKNFFLEKLIEASPAAIIILDKNENITSINPAAKQLIRLDEPEIFPGTIIEFPPPWNDELLRMNNNGSDIILTNNFNKYKCYKSFFIDRGVKQTFFIIEELTREIWKAEKQSYEKVIRMMSHEVNNSVGAVDSIIKSSINYLENSENDKHKDFTHALNIASERISNLNFFTKRFADIIKIPPPEKVCCNVAKAVNHALIGLQSELEKRKINVAINIPYSAPEIYFDYQQLELVLHNIVKNAVQSITENGQISIRYFDEPSTLIIENNGSPIPAEIQQNLFEPFYTTKKDGQGIGLTLIREILINHSCKFSLHSRKDGITEFRIIFS